MNECGQRLLCTERTHSPLLAPTSVFPLFEPTLSQPPVTSSLRWSQRVPERIATQVNALQVFTWQSTTTPARICVFEAAATSSALTRVLPPSVIFSSH